MTSAFIQASCEGKKPFTSMKRAEEVAKRIRRRYCERVAPYSCVICRRIHIGEVRA